MTSLTSIKVSYLSKISVFIRQNRLLLAEKLGLLLHRLDLIRPRRHLANKERERERERERETERQRDRETEKETERNRERETERQ